MELFRDSLGEAAGRGFAIEIEGSVPQSNHLNQITMVKSRKTVEDRLAELSELAESHGDAPGTGPLKAALADPNNRVVAKAAELCAERLVYDLESELMLAYERLLQEPLKWDKNCIAKRAIARALVTLDCGDIAFYLNGTRYRQMEPVWGGTVDTAVDVRCSCAMGLAATAYHRTAIALAELLNDPESRARIGAARAIACISPREAEPLLRLKVLIGDEEFEVIGECFSALLSVEPDESPGFIATYLKDSREPIREISALTLGESRLETALPYLTSAWDEAILVTTGFQLTLLRAVALHRSERAFEWLLSLAERANRRTATLAVEALAIYQHNHDLRSRLLHRLAQRKDSQLSNAITQFWPDV